MLLVMTGRGRKPPPRRSQSQAAGGGSNVRKLRDPQASFPVALAELLRSRKIRVPTGLESAPRQAYASQPPSFIDHLADLGNDELQQYAAQIAGYARRQAKRAKDAWEASPLIGELRKRGLAEPRRLLASSGRVCRSRSRSPSGRTASSSALRTNGPAWDKPERLGFSRRKRAAAVHLAPAGGRFPCRLPARRVRPTDARARRDPRCCVPVRGIARRVVSHQGAAGARRRRAH